MPLSKTRKNAAEKREKGSTTILNNYCICLPRATRQDATLASEADSPVIPAPQPQLHCIAESGGGGGARIRKEKSYPAIN